MEISFHDKSLSEFHSIYSSAFEKYQENLDKLSEDIKNLENFFNSKNINIPFSLEIGSYEWPGGTGNTTEFLCWDKFEEKFRLLYKTKSLDYQEISSDPEEMENAFHYSSKPLLQVKIDIRKKAKLKFGDFYFEFAKTLSLEPISKLDEIPF